MRLCKMRIMYYCPVYGHAKYVCSALLKIINLNLNDLVILAKPFAQILSPLIQFQQSIQLAILTFVYGLCFRAADMQAQGYPYYPSLPSFDSQRPQAAFLNNCAHSS